ncbi:MAG: ribose 5-phosphate isomerase B [Deltaproteobacteria bacterium]|nr:ribose 5-phosphate isomerase B [Deltaproteobacteria bacterium]
MKIVLASDHAGFPLKKEVIGALKEIKASFEDLGCHSENSVDYPDFASQVARKVSAGEAERGILLCGTGVGMAITANKFKGVRAAAIGDLFTAKASREHNDLNVLCLGGRVVKPVVAREIVKTFLQTPFAGGRHEKRVEKIKKIEDKNCP